MSTVRHVIAKRGLPGEQGSPIVLALDTTGPQGSLALAAPHGLIGETCLQAPEGYNTILYPAIDALLTQHSLSLDDISLFASASGPGTFTGVRIGLTCVKGLAEALAKPVCAVSNLEALATFGTHPLRAVILDARRNEIYGALYNAAGKVILPERVSTREAFLAELPEGDIEFVSYEGPLAAAIARIALARGGVDPAMIDANYIRRTDAELALKAPSSSRLRM